MYVGRIVAVGRNRDGRLGALYRVSSRSFPNREARKLGSATAILPRPGFEDDMQKNPFIAYNCLTTSDRFAVVSNGTHTDFLAMKLADGLSVRDAMVTVLQAMDYEHDALNTPRIAGVIDVIKETGYLGIVTRSSLHVRAFSLKPGTSHYIATYEHDTPSDRYRDDTFNAPTAEVACDYILSGGAYADLDKPVTAACALLGSSGQFETAEKNAK